MSYALHAVIVRKPIDLQDAKETARQFIDKNKKFFRETSQSYRFRNIPKQRFDKFKTKKLNDQVSLIYGKLKKE